MLEVITTSRKSEDARLYCTLINGFFFLQNIELLKTILQVLVDRNTSDTIAYSTTVFLVIFT